jgi:hypothetical protein
MIKNTGGLSNDAGLYAKALAEGLPTSYSGVAARLAWNVGRAAAAEAEVRRAGMIEYDNVGRGRIVAVQDGAQL